MTFGSLHFSWVLFLTVALLAGGWYWQNKNLKAMTSWIKRDFWPTIIPDFSFNKFKTKWVLSSIGLMLIVASLLRPQWGEHEETIESKGMDILFVLDLSNSMMAEDASPSRLNRAQTFIKKTMTQLADDRVGVVGFAGRAFLSVPLTTDFGYVAEVVESLNPTAITDQGTEIDEAIDVSIKAFERGGSDSQKTSRAIVLISDGENFGKDPIQVASKVKDFGSGFFAFSVGTTEGAPIPIRTDNGILQTYKKDRSGKAVMSRTNPALLSKIAEAAGGKFSELGNTDDAAYVLGKQLLSYNRGSTHDQRQVTKIDRFQIFLGIGILFLIASFFVSYRKIMTFRKISLLVLLFFFNQAQAETFGGYWKNRRGIQEYENQKYEDSVRVFDAARTSDPENSVIDFNHATALAKAKKDEDALYHFEETNKKALNEGDYSTAAKSLYNQGLILKQNQNFDEAFHKLTDAIQMAKISKQPDLELKARQALLQTSQQKEQKQQQQKQQGGSGQEKEQNKKPSKDGEDEQKNEQNNANKKPDNGKREFKSGTLSKEVAESIMNDLSDREKQLYQRKMKERKAREQQNEKDW